MKESRITPLLTPVLASLGLELDGVEILPAGKRRLLRIVVDGDGPAGRGPNLDDIAEATRAISEALDGSDATGEAPYTLEVSSRGIGRPLTAPQHWRRNRDRLVQVRTAGGDDLAGRIVGADDSGAVLDVDGREHRVAFGDVAKALVQVEFNRPKADEED